MCGRYVLAEEPDKIYGRYQLKANAAKQKPEMLPLYNIAPGSILPVVAGEEEKQLKMMRWGLVPHWAEDSNIGYKMINARAETIDKKPSFKKSFLNKRCLVPATGFYEWQKTGNGKIPYLIQLSSGDIFSFAGIYDVWRDAEGKELGTFSIITTAPNSLLKGIHNRMPVILEENEEDSWLSGDASAHELKALLDPFPSGKLRTHAVSRDVNKPQNQGPELLEEVNY